jgi:uncharacterized membrane protein
LWLFNIMLRPRTAYTLILLFAAIWFMVSLLSAYWASHGETFWAAVSRRSFSALCHQSPERSFALWGEPLALCARCTGIYGGLIAGIVIYPLLRSIERTDLPRRGYLVLALGPMAIDFLLGLFHVIENTLLSRCTTGAMAGAGLAFYLVPAAVCLARDLRVRRA